jgi:hypothetical protein
MYNPANERSEDRLSARSPRRVSAILDLTWVPVCLGFLAEGPFSLHS